jgi:beta-lactamase regulating signal transducer with metallopeptidase domain
MTSFFEGLLGGTGWVYLLSLALGATLLSSLGLLAARLLSRRPAPLTHGILIATMLLLLASPLLVALNLHWGFGLVHLPARPAAHHRSQLENAAAITPPAASSENNSFTHGFGFAESAFWDWTPRAEILCLILMAAWALGTAWQTALLIRGLWLVVRLRRSLREPDDPRWALLAKEAARDLGLPRAVSVAISELAPAPVSLGMWRPVIIIPDSLDKVLNDEDRLGILLHESAHVARGDHFAALMQRLARAIFWWQPLVRALGQELDDVQEELCDNHVIRAQGCGVSFARCLVKLAEWALHWGELPTAAWLFGRARGLEHRVTRLLKKERSTTTRLTSGMALGLSLFVLVGGSLLAVGTVKADQTETAEVKAPYEKPVVAPKTLKKAVPSRLTTKLPKGSGAAKPLASAKPLGQTIVLTGTFQIRFGPCEVKDAPASQAAPVPPNGADPGNGKQIAKKSNPTRQRPVFWVTGKGGRIELKGLKIEQVRPPNPPPEKKLSGTLEIEVAPADR